MCGRFCITKPLEAVRELFEVQNEAEFNVRYNVAPSQRIAAVKLNNNNIRELSVMCWGLEAPMTKTISESKPFKMFNARAETIATKPSFKSAFARRRCLIPCDGFYEWRKQRGRKQPFRIGMKNGNLFALAGIYETTTVDDDVLALPGDAGIDTAAIITTVANHKVRPIHPRMPVILSPSHYQLWLSPNTDLRQLLSILRPYESESMAFYRVGNLVNNVKNDSDLVIKPMEKSLYRPSY